jgi:L-ascorbate metabolism protein UlaG (beta-lactamase superfamily)
VKNNPYFWAGRFYNHKNDSIGLRLSNAATCLAGKIARKIAMKKYACDQSISPENWFEPASITQFSSKPVITWIGHSTFLIQIGGLNILTDPVFFNISLFGPRFLKSGISIDDLPKIDFIIISHNHLDHMDLRSIKIISGKYNPTVLVPYGNKKWLESKISKNISTKKIIEKKWWEEHEFDGGLKFTFLPAVHWTSRGLWDINKTLWGSWMIESSGFKIYFAGDTAYAEHFKKIGEIFKEIDVALMPIGPVSPRKLIGEAHTCPREALKGFLDLNAKCFIPMHWGTFRSAYESFSAPAEVLLSSWQSSCEKLNGKSLKLLKVGESALFASGLFDLR